MMKLWSGDRKTILKLSLIFAFAISLSAVIPTPAQAEGDEIQPNPEVEKYILDALITQNHVVLDQAFPNEKDRVISGQFLVDLYRNPDVQNKQWITIRYVTVVGSVEAYNIEPPFDIFLYNVTFKNGVNFGSSHLQRMRIRDSTFEKFVYFDQSVIEKSLELQNDTFKQGIYFKGANIGGDLLLNNAKIMGQELSPEVLFASHPSEFWEMSVGRYFVMDHALLEGETTFVGASFFSASLVDTHFESKADFTNLRVERDAAFDKAVFSREAIFNQASFGNASFAEAVFQGLTTFEESFIGNNFDASKASFKSKTQAANLARLNVGKSLFLNSIEAPAGILLNQSVLNDLYISATDKSRIPSIDLTQTHVERQFEAHSLNVDSLIANGLVNNGILLFENVQIIKNLDLRNANFNLLVIKNLTWPKDPQAFTIRGMTYTDIDIGNQGLTEQTWRGLLALIDTSSYSPQAYQTLGEFLTNKGHPDWAKKVHLAMKRRERDVALSPFSADWLWSWFLDIFTGYGDRPELAFIWSSFVVGIGAWIYRKEEFMIPIDQDEIKFRYNPIWYSFSLFLPYIDLGISNHWEPSPNRVWASNYKHFHKILGWVLMPIALLAFGGVLG